MLATISEPLVSVLMTSYNRELFIADAIASVVDSTYSNFELIIVDDNSNDNTVQIAKEFAGRDSRIQIIINEQNLGDYPNRNKAASYAKGKFLKYVDSDDRIQPNCLQVMVTGMERFPVAGFALCNIETGNHQTAPFVLNPKEAYEYHFFGPGLFHKGPITAMFLTEAFNAIGGFRKGRMISDIDMWHRMALQYPVVVIPEQLVWQRLHPEQELSDKKDFIVAGEQIKWKYLLDPKCELSSSQSNQIKQKRLKRYAGFIISGVKKGNFKQIRTYWKCFLFVYRVKIPSEQ